MNFVPWKEKEPWNTYWSRPYINYRKHHQLFWELIRAKSSGKILDLGCGPACIWEGTNNDVTGIDFSEEGIKQAKINFPKGKFFVSSILSCPLSAHFDTIVLCGVVNYFPDLNPLREEVSRLSRSGTHLLITINDMKGLNERDWSESVVYQEFLRWGDEIEVTFHKGVGWLIEIVV